MLDISISNVKIHDIPKIRAAQILRDATDDVSSFVRNAIADEGARIFLVSVKVDEAAIPFAIVGLEHIHERNQSATIVAHFVPSLVSVIGAAANDTENDCLAYHIKAIDLIIRYAFFTMGLHRVSILVGENDSILESIVVGCGMRQDAFLEDALRENGVFISAGLYSLLVSDYPDYSVAFVPFQKGIVAIRGSGEAVEGTRFYLYEQSVDDSLDRSVAIRIGIADQNGFLYNKQTIADMDLQDIKLRSEVDKCAKELREYFDKRRTKFDVRVSFPYGSDFQKHVWEQLCEIPFGVTVSYEDIALALTANDKIAARNLTRAVGSACSDNPLPILVPCHRVIGKDGRLIGFSGGVEIKDYLLNHEMFGIYALH